MSRIGCCVCRHNPRNPPIRLCHDLAQTEPGEEILVGDDFEEHQGGEANHGETTIDLFGIEVKAETGEGFVGSFGVLGGFGGLGFGGHGNG